MPIGEELRLAIQNAGPISKIHGQVHPDYRTAMYWERGHRLGRLRVQLRLQVLDFSSKSDNVAEPRGDGTSETAITTNEDVLRVLNW